MVFEKKSVIVYFFKADLFFDYLSPFTWDSQTRVSTADVRPIKSGKRRRGSDDYDPVGQATLIKLVPKEHRRDGPTYFLMYAQNQDCKRNKLLLADAAAAINNEYSDAKNSFTISSIPAENKNFHFQG